jgi:hypothetical protein
LLALPLLCYFISINCERTKIRLLLTKASSFAFLRSFHRSLLLRLLLHHHLLPPLSLYPFLSHN